MKPKSDSQTRPEAPSRDADGTRPIQTGALSGGQPGQGVNTSSSSTGQSNVDASVEQGTEYGRKDRDHR